jgi:hypothetical protein
MQEAPNCLPTPSNNSKLINLAAAIFHVVFRANRLDRFLSGVMSTATRQVH